jgi:hypothetical protein
MLEAAPSSTLFPEENLFIFEGNTSCKSEIAMWITGHFSPNRTIPLS